MILKSLLPSALVVIAALTLASSAMGQQIDKRIDRQMMRIDQGLQRRTLSPEMARRLRATDTRIHAREVHDRTMNHGQLTGPERKRLNRALNRNSRRIAIEKHRGSGHP